MKWWQAPSFASNQGYGEFMSQIIWHVQKILHIAAPWTLTSVTFCCLLWDVPSSSIPLSSPDGASIHTLQNWLCRDMTRVLTLMQRAAWFSSVSHLISKYLMSCYSIPTWKYLQNSRKEWKLWAFVSSGLVYNWKSPFKGIEVYKSKLERVVSS